MSEEDLKQTILGYIVDLYDANYVGYINVKKNVPIYVLELGIPSYLQVTSIGYDTESDEEFLNYIYNELKKRNYMRVYTYNVIKENEAGEER